MTTLNSFSLEDVIKGEETVLAGLGLKNLCRVSECEPGTLYALLCKIQCVFLAFSSMLKVHSIDPSSNVGAFGFR